jgi:hypothetical protein
MTDPLLQILDPTVGVVLLTCAAVAWIRRPNSRVGMLLVAAGGCWFLGSLWSAALFLHRGPMVQLHLSYPTGRVRRPPTVATVVAAYVVAVLEGFVDNPWLTLGLAVIVAVAAIDVFMRTSGKARKAGGPALGAALAFAGVLALSSANLLLGWDADRQVLLAYDATICAVAVVLTADLLRGRWTDATVADLVTQLGGHTDTAGLQGELRRALGDPILTVGYWLAEVGAYVDEAGTVLEVDGRDGRAITTVVDRGEPVAVLVHDPAILDDQALVDGATAALRLAVANVRMRAQVRARVGELAAARRRIVEAADAQRRGLETELAAGAERRLNSVARLLDEARDMVDESVRDTLGEVRAEVRGAQAELREFAQGSGRRCWVQAASKRPFLCWRRAEVCPSAWTSRSVDWHRRSSPLSTSSVPKGSPTSPSTAPQARRGSACGSTRERSSCVSWTTGSAARTLVGWDCGDSWTGWRPSAGS